jgi:hypothetical protein
LSDDLCSRETVLRASCYTVRFIVLVLVVLVIRGLEARLLYNIKDVVVFVCVWVGVGVCMYVRVCEVGPLKFLIINMMKLRGRLLLLIIERKACCLNWAFDDTQLSYV